VRIDAVSLSAIHAARPGHAPVVSAGPALPGALNSEMATWLRRRSTPLLTLMLLRRLQRHRRRQLTLYRREISVDRDC